MKRLIESSNVYMRDSGWLQAEVQVRDEDVGFVQAGQLVSIKVAAYPFQKYGLIESSIQTMAPDAQAPTARTQTPYKATKPSLHAYSGNHRPLIREFVTSWHVTTSTLWWKSTKASDRNRSLMNDS